MSKSIITLRGYVVLPLPLPVHQFPPRVDTLRCQNLRDVNGTLWSQFKGEMSCHPQMFNDLLGFCTLQYKPDNGTNFSTEEVV